MSGVSERTTVYPTLDDEAIAEGDPRGGMSGRKSRLGAGKTGKDEEAAAVAAAVLAALGAAAAFCPESR